MDKLLLRGYVTPEDFSGSDTEKLQAALDYAAKADIRKVVICGDYTADKVLTIPAQTHLVLESGVLNANLQCEKISNYAFEQKPFCIQSKGGKLVGSLYFYNSRRAILEDLDVEGNVTFEYSREMRMERCKVAGQVQVGQGCANAIFQDLETGSFLISNKVFCGDIVPAKEPDIKNIVLRRSAISDGVALIADTNSGMFNIQVDQIKAQKTAVTIGEKGVQLPAERYFNLTVADLESAEVPFVAHNEVKHAYIR